MLGLCALLSNVDEVIEWKPAEKVKLGQQLQRKMLSIYATEA